MKEIDFYFSIGSTYTYLTVERIFSVEKENNVKFIWKPFSVRQIMIEMNNIPFPKEKINKVNKLNIKTDDFIIPGFIDLHCHGANGFDTMDGWDSIKKMTDYHLKKGTTSILPTTWTSTFEHTFNALKGFRNYNKENSNILGVHLEGPFINPNKLGAQPNLTEKPSLEFVKKILEISDAIKHLSLIHI